MTLPEKQTMFIRKAHPDDISEILQIYDIARKFMRASGNFSQWGGGYPGEALLSADIQSGNLYVMCLDSTIEGVFALIPGEDPTYRYIENGAWHSSRPYATIHRLASRGTTRGIAKACFDFCLERSSYLRIDTHEDNRPMQQAVTRCGFQKSGTIYLTDGSPRIAFDFIRGR